jgi:cyclopropane fatty-acyl-phospholipid synthase-like methyltransferase
MVGPAHLWELKRCFQEDFLRVRGLAPEHHLLDIGCGTLRGGIPLIAHLEPGHYCGVEVRAEVLEEAHKELTEAGLEHRAPRLVLCEDIASLAFEDLGRLAAFGHVSGEPVADAQHMMRFRLLR